MDAALELHRLDAGFVWLSFVDAGAEGLRGLADTFGLHGLACADILALHECPKFEAYDDDVYLVILRTRLLRRPRPPRAFRRLRGVPRRDVRRDGPQARPPRAGQRARHAA